VAELALLRVRLVVDDFPAALRFYATLMKGACVTKDEAVDACHIWTGEDGAEIELLSTAVAAETLGEPFATPGVTLVCWTEDVDGSVESLRAAGGEVLEGPRDVAPGATRFARVRARDGCLVEVTRPAVATWGGLVTR
jgi:predicted enzyme related to lactoylglutathione lyase